MLFRSETARKKAEEEAKKLAEEQARKKAEEEAKKIAEEQARKKAEEEAKKLDFDDPDSVGANSCATTNLKNVSVTTVCACNNGICSVEILAPAAMTGIAGFNYYITDNNQLDSNVATVILHPNFPNKFISIPQNLPHFTSLASNEINDIFIDQGNGYIYVSTDLGLSISTNAGLTWTTKATTNGLGSKTVS